MTTDVLMNRFSSLPLDPNHAPADHLVTDPELVTAVDKLYTQAEGHIGLLIANLQFGIEQKKDDEIRKALEKNKEFKTNVQTLNDFLKHLEAALSNPSAQTINLADQSELVSRVNNLISHDLLTKTEWSRDEAEALCKIVPRFNEQELNKINDHMRDINQMVEDRHELLSIFRDLLKMIREMHEVFIRNQRV